MERMRKAAWAILLLTLPVTSFPYFPDFMGLSTAVVRPLALYPLIVLTAIEVLPSVLRKERLPAAAAPLAAFCMAAAAATVFSFVDPPFPLAGQTPLSRALRAFVTLGIGIAFLYSAWRMSARRDGGVQAARWILIGSTLSMLWGGLQAVRLSAGWPGYEQMNILHRFFSVRDMHLYRVTGLAYEPSWFADHLVVLTIPLLLASLATSQYLFSKGRRGLLITCSLLALSLANLLFTYSRGGIAVCAGIAILLLVFEGFRRRLTLRQWFRAEDVPNRAQIERRRVTALRWSGALIGGTAVLVGIGYILSRNDYFLVLWSRLGRISNLRNYLVSIGSGPRLALWQAGLGVFMEHPFVGVGLGQSGFWMWDQLPVWVFNYRSEIMETFASATMGYPNPKNLWIKLLAETGLLGIMVFGIFFVLVILLAFHLYLHGDRHQRFIGLFGILSLTAIMIEGFSLDSFANPTMWISAGMLLGAIRALPSGSDVGASDA